MEKSSIRTAWLALADAHQARSEDAKKSDPSCRWLSSTKCTAIVQLPKYSVPERCYRQVTVLTTLEELAPDLDGLEETNNGQISIRNSRDLDPPTLLCESPLLSERRQDHSRGGGESTTQGPFGGTRRSFTVAGGVVSGSRQKYYAPVCN